MNRCANCGGKLIKTLSRDGPAYVTTRKCEKCGQGGSVRSYFGYRYDFGPKQK